MLTGPEIIRQVKAGRITIDPFDESLVNPNSVNVTLGTEIKWYDPKTLEEYNHSRLKTVPAVWGTRDAMQAIQRLASGFPIHEKVPLKATTILRAGFVLEPFTLYLGTTVETVGSNHYIPILNGRSSLGRQGVMVHVTAGFGDCSFLGQWTLEIMNVSPIPWIIYPGMQIAQVAFYTPEGEIRPYAGKYQGQTGATESRLHLGK